MQSYGLVFYVPPSVIGRKKNDNQTTDFMSPCRRGPTRLNNPSVARVSAMGSYGITRHEVGHVLCILTLPLTTQTNGRAREQQGGDECPANSNPGNEVGPIVHDGSVVTQEL